VSIAVAEAGGGARRRGGGGRLLAGWWINGDGGGSAPNRVRVLGFGWWQRGNSNGSVARRQGCRWLTAGRASGAMRGWSQRMVRRRTARLKVVG
jgi:hypothetical protein